MTKAPHRQNNDNAKETEKLVSALRRMRQAFAKAAAKDTGAVRPLFQLLDVNFDILCDALVQGLQGGTNIENFNKVVAPQLELTQRTMSIIAKHAARDPRAARVMNELRRDLQELHASLLEEAPKPAPKPVIKFNFKL
jgi:hypothetical protein